MSLPYVVLTPKLEYVLTSSINNDSFFYKVRSVTYLTNSYLNNQAIKYLAPVETAALIRFTT
jgi:hypothetical protein